MFHVDLFPSHSYRLFEGHSLSGLCNKTNEPIAWEWMQLKWNWKRLQFFLVGQHVIFYDFHLLFSSPFPLLFVCLCVSFLSFFLTVIKSKKDTVKKSTPLTRTAWEIKTPLQNVEMLGPAYIYEILLKSEIETSCRRPYIAYIVHAGAKLVHLSQ